MKVIDLLNKIANGEKPTIKDGINIYEYNEIENDYITGMGYNYEHYFSSISNILDYLNDEIEIIEDKEDKKIENNNKINRLQGYVPARLYLSKNNYDEDLRHALENIGYKVNEIIDRLNGEDNE